MCSFQITQIFLQYCILERSHLVHAPVNLCCGFQFKCWKIVTVGRIIGMFVGRLSQLVASSECLLEDCHSWSRHRNVCWKIVIVGRVIGMFVGRLSQLVASSECLLEDCHSWSHHRNVCWKIVIVGRIIGMFVGRLS